MAFDLQGHRGARGLAPENTLVGFARALAIGVTTLETDLAVTRDGVLVLSQHLAERYALQLLGDDAQGVGYLLKDRVADLADFLGAVRKVAAGGTALDPEVVARMMGRRRRASPLEGLTPRERDVLALMVEGLSNRGIADRLHVSPPAVEKHVTSIFEKLELGHDRADHRRVLAVLTVLRAS